MKTINFKKFIELSKFVTEFNQHNIGWKIKFYILAPIRFKIFKSAYKEEMMKKKEGK